MMNFEAQSLSLEDVLELLETREAFFETLSQAKSPMRQSEKVKIAANLKGGDVSEKNPKEMDLTIKKSKNANDYIRDLAEVIEPIKANIARANKSAKKYLKKAYTQEFVLKLKSKVFALLSRVPTMKSNTPVDFMKYEQLLLTTLQLDMMTSNQKDSLVNLYKTFCAKEGRVADPKVIDSLPNGLKKNNNPKTPKNNNNLQQLIPDSNHSLPIVEKKIFEESKISDHKPDEIVDVQCIICMKDTRKIVFLPCWHFLSCAGCSVKIIKCPMCDIRIEKYQKIFWS